MIPSHLRLKSQKIFPFKPEIAHFKSPDGRLMKAIHLATVHGICGGVAKTYVFFEEEPRGLSGGRRFIEWAVERSGSLEFKQIEDQVEWEAVRDFLTYQGIGGDTADKIVYSAIYEKPIITGKGPRAIPIEEASQSVTNVPGTIYGTDKPGDMKEDEEETAKHEHK